MFCSDPCEDLAKKDVLSSLIRTSIDNPSNGKIIFKSFVKELSFWEMNEVGNQTATDDEYGVSNMVKRNKSSRIPTMREAIEMDNQYLGSDDNSEISLFSKTVWRTAIDSKSGKVYYFDTISRKSQWEKPTALKDIEKKNERKRIARQFFDEMEKNVMKSQARGEMIPGIPLTKIEDAGPPKEPFPRTHVRTISAMHGVLFDELEESLNMSQREQHSLKPSHHTITSQRRREQSQIPPRPPLPTRGISNGKRIKSYKNTHQRVEEEKVERQVGEQPTCLPSNEASTVPSKLPAGHSRRNTEGTIYLQSTMTNPDINATIKCVCGVYWNHIIQSMEDERRCQMKKAQKYLEFNVFDDIYSSSRREPLKDPSLAEITEFYKAFYLHSQMEHDTIIFSLIYVERLIKLTNGILVPSPQNWKSLLFSCMALASKVWDDLSMWNYDFANVSAHTDGLASFTLPRINELELNLLKCLKFKVKVAASEYAKYYFLIRNMLLRNRLVKEDAKPLGRKMTSEKLEILNGTSDECLIIESRDQRPKSMDLSILEVFRTEENNHSDPVFSDSVCLEQLMQKNQKI